MLMVKTQTITQSAILFRAEDGWGPGEGRLLDHLSDLLRAGSTMNPKRWLIPSWMGKEFYLDIREILCGQTRTPPYEEVQSMTMFGAKFTFGSAELRITVE